MKYKGRQLKGPRKIIVPILRSEEEGGNIIFELQGVTTLDPFYKICPQPEAPKLRLPGGKTRDDVENKGYKDALERWWKKRAAYQILKSLEPTKHIEWELVNMSDPDTYEKWEDELRESGFSDNEIGRIINSVFEVNGLNENMIEEARQSFLTSQEDHPNGQSSHKVEAKTM